MTLLDDYRRTVYSTSDEERRRRLAPLKRLWAPVAPGSGGPSQRESASSIGRSQRPRKLKPSRSIRLETLSPVTLNAREQRPESHDGDDLDVSRGRKKPQRKPANATSNQQETGVESRDALQKKPSVLGRLLVLSAAAERQSGGHTFRTPTELPSQFVHGTATVNISRWTTIVSDVTLQRIAARNRRLHNTIKQRLLLKSPLASPASGEKETPTRAISMNGAELITDIGLRAIADHVPTLEALEMANASNVTDAGLRAVAGGCPHLQRLNISQCRGIRGAGLGAIAELCTRVSDFQVADCSQLSEWVLLRCFFSFSASLQHVNFARCSQITDNLLKQLAHQCTNLKTLQLTDCTQVTDVGVVHVAQKCRSLQKLVLSRDTAGEKLTDTSCAALGEHCPRLRELYLSGCNFLTDAGIRWIASGCCELEVLDVSNVFHLTDATMRALSDSCPKLRTLRISNVKNVSDVGLRFISMGCARLESLHVSNLYLVSDGANRDFGLEGLQAVAKGCSHLKDLNLSGCFQLVERALVAVGSSCGDLTRVSLKACPKITLVAVNALLRGCPSLVALNLSGVLTCNNAMLAAIAAHGVSLKELTVSQCDKISDAGLRHLAARADQFESIDVSGCSLISDAGLSALIDGFQRPALTHLYLAGCSLITQDSIARLAFACPLLLTLSVHGCRVSARVLQSLSSSWPFGQLRVPTGAAATLSSAEFGIFPVHRAKDKRFVEETCALWAAAVKVQSLFRRRLAWRDAVLKQEQATRLYVARRLQSIWRGRKARREALLKKLMRSGLERSAIKIQRQYRAMRQSRKAQTQMQSVFEMQIEKFAVIVQRRYRSKRAATIANAIMAARRREHQRETAAAIHLQRRYRGIAARKRFNVLQIQKQVREREQREASLRIQAIYRGRMDRKKAKQAQLDKQLELRKRNKCALQIQSQVRRHLAWREAERRRACIRFREQCAVKLQAAFRARRARQMTDMLRLAQRHAEMHAAAKSIQRHFRCRRDRVGFAILAETKRRRLERQLNAAVHLQRTYRRYLIRKRARGVMLELLLARQRDVVMEAWAATLVQAHWRRLQAMRELERLQAEKRSRWKQLIDTYNQHGMGYGAPFFYNQCNGDIRWRMPREILTLQPRPGCNQCETPASASVECATCSEFFCNACHEVVHGHGKRRSHETRNLFNFYGIRCDYGDGVFPSVWPSEILHDSERGYDFVTQTPKENYQQMLWQIAQFVPVETGAQVVSREPQVVESSAEEPTEHAESANADLTVNGETTQQSHQASTAESVADGSVLFLENDVDENGNSLWESFFDYGSQEYRYYHRITKRVVSSFSYEAQNADETVHNPLGVADYIGPAR